MTKFLGSCAVYAIVCALFLLAVSVTLYAGGSLPVFSGDLKIASHVEKVAHGPTFPPDPWSRLA